MNLTHKGDIEIYGTSQSKLSFTTDGTNISSLPIPSLMDLPIVLSSLRFPTGDNSANTLKVNDTIQFFDGLTGPGATGNYGSIGLTNGNLLIDSSNNIIIDPSNTLIVLGNLDMSGNNISQVNNITATTFIGDLSGNSTNALNILATSDNTSGTYYLPFIKTAGTGQKALFIDDSITPSTLNPNTGDFRIDNTLKIDASNNNIGMGVSAGLTSQGANAVAIGRNAGQTSQGASAIAIGNSAGQTGQHANTVILNATGSALNSAGTSRTYIAPIRNVAGNGVLQYNATSSEVSYSSTINSTGNITIDPSNSLIVLGNLDMSGNNILHANRLEFYNGLVTPYIELNSGNQLWIANSPGYSTNIEAFISQVSIGDINNNGNYTKLLVDDGNRKIELNAVDIVSNIGTNAGSSYTLPIQFTNKASGSYSYPPGSGSVNQWEMVYFNTMNIPLELLTTSGYSTWKMDFAINCWNMTNQSDKAYAMYIEIRDVGTGNDYQGFLFNQNTPYTTYKNGSGYSYNSYSQIENYIYTDYFDFNNPISGSGPPIATPLEIRLWRYADNNMTCDFNWLLTLSKNNLV
jgi:hypothetical protein